MEKNIDFDSFEEYLKMNNSMPVSFGDLSNKGADFEDLDKYSEFNQNIIKEQEDFDDIENFLLFEELNKNN